MLRAASYIFLFFFLTISGNFLLLAAE